MTLADLLHAAGLPSTGASADPAVLARDVAAIAYDSRRLTPGALFVTWRGRHADGAAFAADALARGAVAVVAESPPPVGVTAPWIAIADARTALARLAVAFYRFPADELSVVGITGTNGKTTTAYVLSAIFERAGVPCGRLGTVSYRVRGEEREAPRTTPEAPDLQALLREMADGGCGACVMEVSSHALALRRVDGTRFTAGVFTNLTRDHLDFHGDMESYFAAKRRLFEMLPSGAPGVINADDPQGARLAATTPRALTFAIDRPADVAPGPIDQSVEGLRFDGPPPPRWPSQRLQHPCGVGCGPRARPAHRRHRARCR